MDYLEDLLDHMQQAINRGEGHGTLAYKMQNIRAALQRVKSASVEDTKEGKTDV